MTQVNKYNHSKIYKICSNLTDKIYIGSTTQTLSQRLSEHVRHYKQYVRNNINHITSYEIIKLGDYYITLIEENNFNNKQQLFKREGEVIKLNLNIVVNKIIAGRTHTEYYNDNHETILDKRRQYNIDNKQVISEYKKQYNIDNKQVISEHKKQYNIDNKQVISERNKQQYINNKQQRLELNKQQLFNNELNHYTF